MRQARRKGADHCGPPFGKANQAMRLSLPTYFDRLLEIEPTVNGSTANFDHTPFTDAVLTPQS
jgi:hypothetical protein